MTILEMPIVTRMYMYKRKTSILHAPAVPSFNTYLYNPIYSLGDKVTHETKTDQTASNTPEPGQTFDVLARDKTMYG